MTFRRQPTTAGRRPTKAWIIATASAALAVYASALTFEGFGSATYSRALTYPFVDRPAAERAYAELPLGASSNERKAAARRLVRGDPANPESWAAAAFVERQASGRLASSGRDMLKRSYALGFFDRPLAVWRVAFALDNWENLTPELREQAVAETKVALADPVLRPLMERQLQATSDPAGRLAALLMLAEAPPSSGMSASHEAPPPRTLSVGD